MSMSTGRYPGTYRDARGDEPIEIRNDGKTLRVEIRGIEFVGSDFDALDPVSSAEDARRAGFVLNHGSLCSCEITCEMNIPIAMSGPDEVGTLAIDLVLGAPAPNGGIDREELRLELGYPGGTVRSAGTSGWFEDELLDLHRKLPGGAYLRACISCGLSDYDPAGHGLFGWLACFRGNKAGYRAVTTKH
jgi:hypothetical protein